MPGQPHPVCYTAPLMPPAPLTLILNADVHAPEPLGLCSLLLGGGRVLWLGEGRPQLDARLMVAQVDLQGRPLVPGLAFTVEPGVYLPGLGGVRLEELVLLTESGVELLSRFPRDFQEF